MRECPFCGNTEVEVVVKKGTYRGIPTSVMTYTNCLTCGATGPAHEGTKESTELVKDLWNTRYDDTMSAEDIRQTIEEGIREAHSTLKDRLREFRDETKTVFNKDTKEEVKSSIIDFIKKI